MRWLFIFVLSLNLAYIGWEMSRSSSENYADVPALKNVETIVLLSELKQQQKQQGSKQRIGSSSIEKAKGVADASAEVSAVENTSAENKVADQAALKQVQVKSQVKTVVPEQPDPEQPATETVKIDTARSEPSAPAKDVSPEPVQSARCYTLGPFRDLDKLRRLTREIKSYVIEADFRGREEREQTLYWVYLKPEKNQAKAIATGKRLKAKKIKDFYVIRDGEKINGLSLGHFRNKSGAYGLAKKVKNLGFNVIVEPVFRTYTIYWLDYQLAGGVSIPESIFDKHIKSAKKDNISRLSRDCGS